MRSLALVLFLGSLAISQEPPRSSPATDESSSKQTKIDLSPPPGSRPAEGEDDVQEMKPYDPHRAAKDIEVAEYHLKNKNYKAAEVRLREALEYKPNDAEATLLLAQTLEKEEKFKEARESYGTYLKNFPKGQRADEARRAEERLQQRSRGENGKSGGAKRFAAPESQIGPK